MDSQHTSHPTTYAYSNPHYPEFYDLYIRTIFGCKLPQDSIHFPETLSSILRTKVYSVYTLHPTAKVVDIGTGTGRVIKELLCRLSADGIDGNFVNLVRVDHSSSMLERAKSTTQMKCEVTWIQASATSFLEQVPEVENEADLLIFAAGGSSHLTADGEVLEFLEQVRRVLKKSSDSIAIVSVLHEFIPGLDGSTSDTEKAGEETDARVFSEEHPGLVYVKSPTRKAWTGDVRTDRFVVKRVKKRLADTEANDWKLVKEGQVWQQEMV